MRLHTAFGTIVLMSVLLWPQSAAALDLRLDGTAYSFGPPDGFVEVRDNFPRLYQSAVQSMPQGHRLLQFYLADSALERYRTGERLDVNAHGSLAWIETLGRQVNKVDYIFIRRYLVRQYGPQVDANREAVERLQRDYLDGEVDNERLRQRLNAGEPFPAALVDNGESAVTYVTLQRGIGHPLGEGDDRLLACSMTLKRLGRQVFSLRLCEPYVDRGDIDQLTGQLARWAQQLAAANP